VQKSTCGAANAVGVITPGAGVAGKLPTEVTDVIVMCARVRFSLAALNS
jgi:hypothetical protein